MRPDGAASAAASSEPGRASSIAGSLTSREWDQLVDVVLRRIERRTLDDLSRRGRRVTPRVF